MQRHECTEADICEKGNATSSKMYELAPKETINFPCPVDPTLLVTSLPTEDIRCINESRGVHPSGAMMHFPLFQIPPLFPKKFLTENFIKFTFSREMFLFSSAKFFSHKPQISNSPYFHYFNTFPLFRQNYSFLPTFTNVPSVFGKFTCFYILYVFFVSPYFYHDAFMHHTKHVLDAPGQVCF